MITIPKFLFNDEGQSLKIGETMKPLYDALGDAPGLVCVDLYMDKTDFIIPSLGVQFHNGDHSIAFKDLPGPLRASAGESLMAIDSLTTEIIYLIEYWQSQTQAGEEGYYLRLWIDRSGLVAITPEDMDGWYSRNSFFLSIEDNTHAGVTFCVNAQSAHSLIGHMETLTSFDERLMTPLNTQLGMAKDHINGDIAIQKVNDARRISFGG